MSESHADCVFCNIVNGKLPADKVYEDDLVEGFWDENPVAAIHILLCPQTYPNPQRRKAGGSYPLPAYGQVASKIAEDFGVAQTGYRLSLM